MAVRIEAVRDDRTKRRLVNNSESAHIGIGAGTAYQRGTIVNDLVLVDGLTVGGQQNLLTIRFGTQLLDDRIVNFFVFSRQGLLSQFHEDRVAVLRSIVDLFVGVLLYLPAVD